MPEGLRPYAPSWRDRLRWGLEDVLSGLGASRSAAQRYGDQLVGSPSSHGLAAADFVPVLGNFLAANEAKRSYDQGDYVGAGLNAIGALPGLPIPAAAKPVASEFDDALARMAAAIDAVTPEQALRVKYPKVPSERIAARAAFGHPRDLRAFETYPGGLDYPSIRADERRLPPWAVMDPDQIRRAEQAGANTDLGLYHGTTREFSAFAPAMARSALEPYVYATDRPRIADEFSAFDPANPLSKVPPPGRNTLPLLTTAKNIVPMDVRDVGHYDNPLAEAVRLAKEQGGDALALRGIQDLGGAQTQYVFWDPSLLRSRFAQFDPAKRGSDDLLAGISGLGALGGGAALSYPAWRDRQE